MRWRCWARRALQASRRRGGQRQAHWMGWVRRQPPPQPLAGGPVLFHEHLSMHYPPQVKQHFTDDVALMVEEVRAAGKDGIACIVDGGHPDMTRSLDALKRIATESGVAIVASGGYYMQRTYPPEIAARSADE